MLEVVRRLILYSLLTLSPCALAQDSFDWETITSFSLAPGERKILLLEQQGFDLAMRVLQSGQGSGLPSDEPEFALLNTHSVQEGPDYSFGTEVLALENSAQQSIAYTIQFASVLNLPRDDITFRLSEIEAFATTDWVVALALHAAAQIWLRPESRAEEVIALLEPLREQSVASQLQDHLWLIYAEALVRSGQTERAIATLANYLEEKRLDDASSVYLQWQYVIALYQGLYVPQALQEAELLVTAVESLPVTAFSTETEQQWMIAQATNSLAAIQVGAARTSGDDALMENAEELMRNNLAAVQDFPDPSLRARLIQYLAGFYSFSEGRSNAISQQLLLDAERIYQSVADNDPLSALRNNQAYAALGRGEVNEALGLYLEALELRKFSKHEEGHAFVRARLGYLYFTLGDYRRARIRYEESIAMYQRLGLQRQLFHTQLELAEVLRAAQEHEAALTLLFAIRDAIEEGESIEAKLRLASQTAHNLIDLGDNAAAAEIIAGIVEEMNLSSASGRDRLEFASRLFYVLEFDILQARLQLADWQSDAALALIDNALALLADRYSEPLQNLELLYLRMQAYAMQSASEHIVQTGRQALALIDAVAGAVDYQFQGARWASRTAHIQQLMVSTYLNDFLQDEEMSRLENAMALIQQSRAINLRQTRTAAGTNTWNAEVTELAGQVAEIRQELVSAVLAGLPSAALESELARREEQLERSRLEQFAGNPALVYLSREQIQERLSDQTSALIYSVGETSSHLIVLDGDTQAIHELPGRDALAREIDAALAELESPGSDLLSTRQLAQTLLPARLDSASHTLLIEADGVLTRLPFNVLSYFRRAQQEGVAKIVMVPSLSEYFTSTGDSREERADLAGTERLEVAILADPVIAGTNAAAERNIREPEFPRLPYTQLEAESIINTVGRETSRAFLGEEASIENLYGDSARTARILHIASHGFASENDPLLLGLALANGMGNSVASGLVTADQIVARSFLNELVVISACETGVGQALNGEPLMSLGRVFLASGAKAALTTLWPISDRANAQFMSSFYEALWELQLSAAEALSYAQEQLMQTPRYSHPFYWGAFQYQSVQENSRPVLF